MCKAIELVAGKSEIAKRLAAAKRDCWSKDERLDGGENHAEAQHGKPAYGSA